MATKRNNANNEHTPVTGDSAINDNGVSVEFNLDAFILNNVSEFARNKLTRLEREFNTVRFVTGKNAIVSVTRLNHQIAAINAQHKYNRVANQPVHFEAIFAAKYTIEYKSESISRTLGIIGIMNGRAYLLTNTFNLALQSSGKEDQSIVVSMVNTVSKAIKLASQYGIYDSANMCFSNVEQHTKTRKGNVISVESGKIPTFNS